MPIEESLSAGTKSGTPYRAHAPRMEPLSCRALTAERARKSREERIAGARESAKRETARSVSQYFSSSMKVS